MSGPGRPPDQVQVRDAFVAFTTGSNTVMALRGLDLSLAAAERLLVLGPNGSGKSTLLRVITGELPLLAGEVVVAGTALHELGPTDRRRWRARRVGFVDQHARRGLLPDLGVVDNVALQLRLTGAGRRAARERAEETLGRLGLAGLSGRSVVELSGGEAQRVAVCAAVAHGPDLVLADEPTGELDEAAAAEVHALLGVVAAAGAGVILVSHDPRSTAFADRVVRIDGGRAAEQWTSPAGAGGPYREQLVDSRGWVRVPVDLAPELDAGRLVPSVGPAGLLLSRGTVRAPTPTADEVASPAWTPDERNAGPATVLRLRGVGAGYGTTRLFRDVDLDARPGRWTLVTGASGSGKSTLLALAAGLLDPQEGTVAVGGPDGATVSWATLDRTARARLRAERVGVVPQRAALVESLTVAENLALSARLHSPSGQVGSVVQAAAGRLDLVPLLDVPVGSLSGGERQRTSLARCLTGSAPLLVLDEPTTQLDAFHADQVLAVLDQEARAGRALLMASHDPRVLARADHVVDLDPLR